MSMKVIEIYGYFLPNYWKNVAYIVSVYAYSIRNSGGKKDHGISSNWWQLELGIISFPIFIRQISLLWLCVYLVALFASTSEVVELCPGFSIKLFTWFVKLLLFTLWLVWSWENLICSTSPSRIKLGIHF